MHELRHALLRQIRTGLRYHYIIDDSEFEEWAFERLRPELEVQVIHYEFALRYNAILNSQAVPPELPLNSRTLQRLFSKDLLSMLRASSLLSDDEEDERIFYDEFGESLTKYLASFAAEVSQQTESYVPEDENGETARLSTEEVVELAVTLCEASADQKTSVF